MLQIALAMLILFLVGLGIVEYVAHERNLASIPIRIHINGTRGKSSVVRLVAAAMRAHGIKVVAKTTGTLARLINASGAELPVYRPGCTSVLEQLRMVNVAAREGAEAIVIECMALRPALQSICELRMIRSTHGVVSNAWPDHLDVMGPGVRDVALALAGTTPVRGVLFTTEREHLPIFERACRDRDSRLVALGQNDIEEVRDEEIERFSYLEHKENVALALAVTRSLGIPRAVALEGMLCAEPDAGALRELEVDFFGRRVVFVSGFAANDPIAAERVWRLTLERHSAVVRRIMVINCRLDRPERSRQIGEALSGWPSADRYLLVGTGTYALARTAVATGLPPHALVSLEGRSAPDVFEEIMGVCGRSTVVMGSGNIAGVGLELLRLFQNRATPAEVDEADVA